MAFRSDFLRALRERLQSRSRADAFWLGTARLLDVSGQTRTLPPIPPATFTWLRRETAGPVEWSGVSADLLAAYERAARETQVPLEDAHHRGKRVVCLFAPAAPTTNPRDARRPAVRAAR